MVQMKQWTQNVVADVERAEKRAEERSYDLGVILLQTLAERDCDQEFAAFLVNEGASLHVRNAHGLNAGQLMAENGLVEAAQAAVKRHDFDVNSPDNNGETLVMRAARHGGAHMKNGGESIIDVLEAAGADMKAQTYFKAETLDSILDAQRRTPPLPMKAVQGEERMNLTHQEISDLMKVFDERNPPAMAVAKQSLPANMIQPVAPMVYDPAIHDRPTRPNLDALMDEWRRQNRPASSLLDKLRAKWEPVAEILAEKLEPVADWIRDMQDRFAARKSVYVAPPELPPPFQEKYMDDVTAVVRGRAGRVLQSSFDNAAASRNAGVIAAVAEVSGDITQPITGRSRRPMSHRKTPPSMKAQV